MGKINREDVLELTRRITLKRNFFDRIAVIYLDEKPVGVGRGLSVRSAR